jgi:hypothetical protein
MHESTSVSARSIRLAHQFTDGVGDHVSDLKMVQFVLVGQLLGNRRLARGRRTENADFDRLTKQRSDAVHSTHRQMPLKTKFIDQR